MLNLGIFTEYEHIARKKNVCTWYDGSKPYSGRGERFDKVFIDTDLSKNIITDIIIPSCLFATDIFVLDEAKENFTKTTIENVLVGIGRC
jgi:hypothetical protein